MGESVPAFASADDMEPPGLRESVPAPEPTEKIGESVLAITFADDMERSRAAIASATGLRESILGVAPGDDMERNRAAIAPATGLGESVPAVEPANDIGETAPAVEPANDMGDSVPAIAPDDVKDSEPTQEPTTPAVTMGDVWERISSRRSSASRFFDR